MKKYRKIVCAALVGGALAFGLSACGDDDSSFAPRDDEDRLSSEVEDGDGSSSSVKGGSSSSKGGSSGSNSSSSAAEDKSSSSEEVCKVIYPEEADTTSASGEPTYEFQETCDEVGACDAMDEKDFSTWHFVREDNFGDDATYTYTVDGSSLILTIVYADGTKDVNNSYSMYDMTKESHVTMAFSAVKSTCKDGNGDKNTVRSCTKDSVLVDPGKKPSSPWPPEDVNAGSKYDASANTLKDLRDGKVYKTVKIGDQVWMAENLNYAYVNETPQGARDDYPGLDSSSFCFNNVAKNCETWGRLYMWSAAMDSAEVFEENSAGCGSYATAGIYASDVNSCNPTGNVRGVCPKGWHLPSKEEVEKLLLAVDETAEETNWGYRFPAAGTMLKSTCGWKEDSGEDKYGFNAIPSGRCYLGKSCEGADSYAYFWTSTQYDREESWANPRSESVALTLSYQYKDVEVSYLTKGYTVPVRCVMD